MANLTSELTSKCGISAEQVEKGLGAMCAFFKEKLPADAYSKISEAVPNAQGLIAKASETAKESGGGVLGAVSGLASKVFGGGTAEVMSKFSQFGFSADQIHKFVPQVMEYLKSKLPEDVVNKISGLIPLK